MANQKQVASDSVSVHSTITSVELAELEKELAAHVDPKKFSEVFERFLTAEDVLSIGKYQIQKVLRKSGQAVVFVAKDPDLHRLVALKLFHSGMSKEDKKLLLREGRALSRINSKRVVKCFAVEKFRECPFLVLEYLPHPTLRDYFESKKPLSEKQIVEILSKICLGLSEVHEIGLVHGDIKPSNVLVTRKAGAVDIRLIDFGMSRHSGDFETDLMGGTPSFMSPECANHDPGGTDFCSDVFGVGAIAFFLMSGRAPFHGKSKSELIEKAKVCKIDFSPVESSGYHPDLINFCKQAMAKDPADRYESVPACHQSLSKIGPGLWTRRNALMGALVLAVGLLITMMVWKKFVPQQTDSTSKFQTILESEFGKSGLRQDFKLKFLIDSKPYTLNQSKPVVLPSDQSIYLSAQPSVESYVAIFSLHFSKDHKEKQLSVLYPPAGEDGLVQQGDQATREVETGESKDVEYVLICASTEKWDAYEFADAFNSAKAKEDVKIFADYWRKVRDMRPIGKSRKLSEAVIPYLSRPPR